MELRTLPHVSFYGSLEDVHLEGGAKNKEVSELPTVSLASAPLAVVTLVLRVTLSSSRAGRW